MGCLYAHLTTELEQFIIATTTLTKSYSRQVSNISVHQVITKI